MVMQRGDRLLLYSMHDSTIYEYESEKKLFFILFLKLFLGSSSRMGHMATGMIAMRNHMAAGPSGLAAASSKSSGPVLTLSQPILLAPKAPKPTLIPTAPSLSLSLPEKSPKVQRPTYTAGSW